MIDMQERVNQPVVPCSKPEFDCSAYNDYSLGVAYMKGEITIADVGTYCRHATTGFKRMFSNIANACSSVPVSEALPSRVQPRQDDLSNIVYQIELNKASKKSRTKKAKHVKQETVENVPVVTIEVSTVAETSIIVPPVQEETSIIVASKTEKENTSMPKQTFSEMQEELTKHAQDVAMDIEALAQWPMNDLNDVLSLTVHIESTLEKMQDIASSFDEAMRKVLAGAYAPAEKDNTARATKKESPTQENVRILRDTCKRVLSSEIQVTDSQWVAYCKVDYAIETSNGDLCLLENKLFALLTYARTHDTVNLSARDLYLHAYEIFHS